MKNKTIAMHDIEMWLDITEVEGLETDDNVELNDFNEEHISKMIVDGYREGELNQTIYKDEDDQEGEECTGWWKINFDNIEGDFPKGNMTTIG